MTQAAYWLAFMQARCQQRSILQDPWCLSMLSQVAGPAWVNTKDPNRAYVPTNAGYDGWIWTFRDTSQIIANGTRTIILGNTDAA
jgi:hypothetical protein